jgi:beta-N-acetylhexosaminidase
MDGVLKKCETVEEASIQALNAGCDILILGGKLISGERAGFELKIPDIKRVHSSIVNAVKTGRVSETRLDQAVEKILNLKNRYLTAQIDMANTVSTDAHHAIAQKIASLALKTTQNGPNLIAPIHQKNIAIFAPQLVQHSLDETSLLNIAKSTNTCFFANLNPSQDEIETAIQHATQADVLFICSYNAWKNPSQITLIQSLLDMEKPTVLLVLRDPIDASLFPNASLVFQTFSPTSPSIEAVCEQLKAI